VFRRDETNQESLGYGDGVNKMGESIYKVKGKAIPLHALTGSEGSRRLRLPDFKAISI
jgi:hypothetical protein